MVFGKTTVDGVLKALTKAITDLEVVEEQQTGKATKAEDEAYEAQCRAAAAFREAKRAARVREKLASLLA